MALNCKDADSQLSCGGPNWPPTGSRMGSRTPNGPVSATANPWRVRSVRQLVVGPLRALLRGHQVRCERRPVVASHWLGMSDDLDSRPNHSPGWDTGTLLLKLDEAARELRCTRRSLERQIAAQRLAVIHIGRAVRFVRAEIEAYLDRLRALEETSAHREGSPYGQTA